MRLLYAALAGLNATAFIMTAADVFAGTATAGDLLWMAANAAVVVVCVVEARDSR